MKKPIVILLSLLFVFALAACGGGSEKDSQLSFEYTITDRESQSKEDTTDDDTTNSGVSDDTDATTAETSIDETSSTIGNNTEDEDESTTEPSSSESETAKPGEPYVGTVKNGSVSYEDGLYYITDSSTGVKFILVNKTYPVPKDYGPGDMTSDTKSAFNKLVEDAKNDGISIWQRTSYRSYSFQNQLYTNYVARDGKKAADTYSARPGHSEHQTGYAIDCNSLSTSWGETPEGKWLASHCTDYGFIIRYGADKISSTGYQYEPWHIRYLGSVELAKKITDSGLSIEEYYGITSEYQ